PRSPLRRPSAPVDARTGGAPRRSWWRTPGSGSSCQSSRWRTRDRGLEQRLEPPEILVHPGARVRFEEFGQRPGGAAPGRAIAESKVDAGAVPLRHKAYDAGVLKHGTRLAAPREEPRHLTRGEHGVPGHRKVAGTGHHPARSPVAEVAHLPQVGE